MPRIQKMHREILRSPKTSIFTAVYARLFAEYLTGSKVVSKQPLAGGLLFEEPPFLFRLKSEINPQKPRLFLRKEDKQERNGKKSQQQVHKTR